jgi:DNA-binding NtrC family response regulator
LNNRKNFRKVIPVTTARRPRSEGRLAKYLRRCERDFILKALRMHRGHNSQTAAWLGVSRRALYDKMRDYGLDGEASAMRTEAGIMGPRKVDLDGGDED